MRVLMTVPSLDREFGGPIGKARSLVGALRARAHDVVLVGAGDSDEERTIGLGRRGSFHATPVPRRLRSLRRLTAGADVVHVIGFRDPVGTVAAREAARRDVPVVLEPAGMVRPRVRSFGLKRGFDRTFGRLVIANAGVVVVTSSIEGEDLLAAGVTADRIAIRPNGVPVDELLPLPARGGFRRSLDIPDKTQMILVLARIGAIKGLEGLMAAVALLPDAHVVVAGPDAHDGTMERLEAASHGPSLAGRVHLLPSGLWGPAKAQALADADVFCLPSDYESFGSAAAEAASVGLPVVLTERCGVRDVLDPAASVVVRTHDHLALANAITDASSMSAAAAKAAPALQRRLDWDTLADEQVAIYEGLGG